jgi:hypothetical protein
MTSYPLKAHYILRFRADRLCKFHEEIEAPKTGGEQIEREQHGGENRRRNSAMPLSASTLMSTMETVFPAVFAASRRFDRRVK